MAEDDVRKMIWDYLDELFQAVWPAEGDLNEYTGMHRDLDAPSLESIRTYIKSRKCEIEAK